MKLKGRPKSTDKLNRSINLKLTENDFQTVRLRAQKLGISATRYARNMTVSGKVTSPFTIEELDLLRKVSGVANNVNQIARRLNSDFGRFKLEALTIVYQLKKLLDDSKKH